MDIDDREERPVAAPLLPVVLTPNPGTARTRGRTTGTGRQPRRSL
ncbi:MAG: hypothetical protein OXG81_08130 [Acidobacteria bacterium]|nr:hypothetical protein [Acidobacteriota bacterium]